MTTLANIPYDQLQVGDTATFQRTLTERDLVLFATVSGDLNPVHLDEDYARSSAFGERIGHGMWTGSLISAALAMVMPGPGGVYRGQELKFLHPVKLGDTLTVELEVLEKAGRANRAVISTNVVNQRGEYVAKGKAIVLPSTESVEVDPVELPDIHIGSLSCCA